MIVVFSFEKKPLYKIFRPSGTQKKEEMGVFSSKKDLKFDKKRSFFGT
jgi:tRNA (Thr-GGU) A37 N-methylase